MTSSRQYIIVDDADSDIRRSSGQAPWLTNRTDVAASFKRTLSVYRTDVNGTGLNVRPRFEITFHGTDIAFYGTASAGLAANYAIDGSNQRPAEIAIGNNLLGKTNVKLWSLTNLPSGQHRVEFFPVSGQFNLDYAVYTPSSSLRTLYVRKTVVKDNQDRSFGFSANHWTHEVGSTMSLPIGLPFSETLSHTKTQGASFTLDFTGSSIAIYGAKNMVSGLLLATFSVDNRTPTVFTVVDGIQRVNSSNWELNSQLYTEALVPGKHTLRVEVTQISGDQVFYVDYATFEASSDTTFDGSSPTTSSSNTNSSNNGTRNIIVGVLAAILILILFLGSWYRRRRRMIRFVEHQRPPYNPHSQSGHNYPLHSSPQNGQYGPWGGAPNANNQWNPPAPPYSPPAWPTSPPPAATSAHIPSWESPIPTQVPTHQSPLSWQPPPGPPPGHVGQSPPLNLANMSSPPSPPAPGPPMPAPSFPTPVSAGPREGQPSSALPSSGVAFPPPPGPPPAQYVMPGPPEHSPPPAQTQPPAQSTHQPQPQGGTTTAPAEQPPAYRE
ncbi:hypothetical protein FA15DRAFT_667784 [Coprinopsis marcescibilis]|uniref:Transmembrane protein n=1 Tax=Coprinopsis marcescibilis TaxID=230819 RepID=A0A5C3KZM5_COPMA|nr:hypothetical protein FA15DRAFT_667784 [Coprinopsis marcescibilis]